MKVGLAKLCLAPKPEITTAIDLKRDQTPANTDSGQMSDDFYLVTQLATIAVHVALA